jgi:hypothetical protein
MAQYAFTFTSGDTVTPTKINDARTVSEIVDADIKSDAAIAGSKLADGAITDAKVDAAAAIAGTKIAPDFGSQEVVTTGSVTAAKIIPTGTSATGNGVYLPDANTVGFSTDGVERMRITDGGALLVGKTADETTSNGCVVGGNGYIYATRENDPVMILRRKGSNGLLAMFRRDDGDVGSISVTTTATTYATSSDYRLKQNVEPMVGGLAKLAELKPSTFEFKIEPGVKVDGFIAHEVQAVVPQAVIGEKDGEDMQGLDHSKLVPVLVAAVQELSAKVAALEAAQNK